MDLCLTSAFVFLALGGLPPAAEPVAQPHQPRPKVAADSKVKRTQVDAVSTLESPRSLSLEAALYGAITSNPDLVSLRQGTVATAEAVEVARRFPTSLNPTLWVDVRPLVYERMPGVTLGNGGHIPAKLNQKDALMYFSLRQPIELGHQTTHRYHIAQAFYNQQRWNVVQAEMTALVQTYRFFQTAAYRREKLRVADSFSTFNQELLVTLRKRLEANQTTAVDVALAVVEARATKQQVQVARQDYLSALADLSNQLGTPETAGSIQPLGEFVLPPFIAPADDNSLIQTALQSRPEIHAARAAVAGANSATKLARADRIPTPVAGPLYERDESGTQFFGFVYITPIPILNNGAPLVRQREAEHRQRVVALQQIEQRTIAQVKAAVSKWNSARELISETDGLTEALASEVGVVERLFQDGQADLTKLLQARGRLIQLENSELDATWQATQAQADLLLALGAPALIQSLQGGSTNPAAIAAPVPAPAAPAPLPPAVTPTPFAPAPVPR